MCVYLRSLLEWICFFLSLVCKACYPLLQDGKLDPQIFDTDAIRKLTAEDSEEEESDEEGAEKKKKRKKEEKVGLAFLREENYQI